MMTIRSYRRFKKRLSSYAWKLGNFFDAELILRGRATKNEINRWNLQKFLPLHGVLCLTTKSGRGLVFVKLSQEKVQEAIRRLENGEPLNEEEILDFTLTRIGGLDGGDNSMKDGSLLSVGEEENLGDGYMLERDEDI